MYKIIATVCLLTFGTVCKSQDRINIKSYAKDFLLKNYKEQILDTIIWGNLDTAKRFSVDLLDSASVDRKTLYIYHLYTNVSEVQLSFLILVQKNANGEEEIKTIGEEGSKYETLVADMLYMQDLFEQYPVKRNTILNCYGYVIYRYR